MRVSKRVGFPDPMQAHGAWVFLFVSVMAGSLLGSRGGVEIPLLVGTAYAGAFLVVAAIVAGLRRKLRQALVGLLLAGLGPILALWLGAKIEFLFIGPLAACCALISVGWARRFGLLAPIVLLAGVASLCMAAPATALAGGASVQRSAMLFAALWPVFAWRSLRIARPLRKGAAWQRETLRSRGLREAAIAMLWSLAAVLAI